jgi:hypothetical protein
VHSRDEHRDAPSRQVSLAPRTRRALFDPKLLICVLSGFQRYQMCPKRLRGDRVTCCVPLRIQFERVVATTNVQRRQRSKAHATIAPNEMQAFWMQRVCWLSQLRQRKLCTHVSADLARQPRARTRQVAQMTISGAIRPITLHPMFLKSVCRTKYIAFAHASPQSI